MRPVSIAAKLKRKNQRFQIDTGIWRVPKDKNVFCNGWFKPRTNARLFGIKMFVWTHSLNLH